MQKCAAFWQGFVRRCPTWPFTRKHYKTRRSSAEPKGTEIKGDTESALKYKTCIHVVRAVYIPHVLHSENQMDTPSTSIDQCTYYGMVVVVFYHTGSPPRTWHRSRMQTFMFLVFISVYTSGLEGAESVENCSSHIFYMKLHFPISWSAWAPLKTSVNPISQTALWNWLVLNWRSCSIPPRIPQRTRLSVHSNPQRYEYEKMEWKCPVCWLYIELNIDSCAAFSSVQLLLVQSCRTHLETEITGVFCFRFVKW